jgi:hypothetical protein
LEATDAAGSGICHTCSGPLRYAERMHTGTSGDQDRSLEQLAQRARRSRLLLIASVMLVAAVVVALVSSRSRTRLATVAASSDRRHLLH